jgi:hypothetical protein
VPSGAPSSNERVCRCPWLPSKRVPPSARSPLCRRRAICLLSAVRRAGRV